MRGTVLSKKYVRICKEYNDFGKLVPVETWHSHVTDYNRHWFRSVGTYNQEQFETFKKAGKVGGMTGVRSNTLIFDFDDIQDLNNARLDTITTLQRLEKQGITPDKLNITFSGNKGFGVELCLEKDYWAKELFTVAKNIAGDLKTWDDSLYDDNQLIRIPGTKHQESGLHKVTLSLDEVTNWSIDDIKAKAVTSDNIEWCEEPNSIPSKLLIDNTPKPKPKKLQATTDIDFSKRPESIPKWKYHIMHGDFPPGKRHNAMLALASHFSGLGFPEEVTRSAVLEASRLQYERNKDVYGNSDPTNEKELNGIVSDVYSHKWTGGTHAYESNDTLKKLICPDEDVLEDKIIVSTSDMFGNFDVFAKNIKFNKIYTGIRELDDKLTITTGMSVGFLGSPGSGKTSGVLSILNHTSGQGIPCMFFSLDMAQNMVYAKLISRETGIQFDDVIKAFEESDPIVESWKDLIGDNFKNVGFCFKSGITIDIIRKEIIRYQNQIGAKVKLVVIDYLELLVGPYADATANGAYQANKIKDITTDLDICTIVLVQPPKRAGDASEPLYSMRQIKGASALEQNFRVVLGMYREGFNPDKPELDRFATFVCLKNTFGSLFKVDVSWDGVTGKVSTLTAEGRVRLQRLRDMKEAEKDAEKAGGNEENW